MTLEEKLEAIGGCSDGHCIVHVRSGMHTNGGCRCLTRDMMAAQRVVRAYRTEVEQLRATVKKLEDEVRGEPVAWKLTVPETGQTFFANEGNVRFKIDGLGYTWQPLYLHPAPSAHQPVTNRYKFDLESLDQWVEDRCPEGVAGMPEEVASLIAAYRVISPEPNWREIADELATALNAAHTTLLYNGQEPAAAKAGLALTTYHEAKEHIQ
ncbi:hypothetical protein UFOVP28_88 [uncultured Caudovirales phage]|uniref:Uncharacterized protein n=1 Tax=uncultured Caudovirales phage TaxID=2100421 RepID=A0A6J5KP05_9CAUD|nr:hypothetical protein UFOVP28_88 [uncultured Caudovirales phage]